MDVTEIKQSLSTLLSNYLICKNCKIVDRNMERMRKGFLCPTCDNISTGGCLYFKISIHMLIDLIQESYHSAKVVSGVERLYEGESSHDISIIIFFCTIREALMDNLIHELLNAQKIPENICERLLKDNKFHTQKQDKLFKSLANIKWNDAIQKLSELHSIDYIGLNSFVLEVVNVRNTFIHEGIKWSIDRALSTKCLKSIDMLVRLSVGLHNSYVHPYYLKKF
jgi:hypothetical protein